MKRLQRFMRHIETRGHEENNRIELQSEQGIYFHVFKSTNEELTESQHF
jgi:hypothetical protein